MRNYNKLLADYPGADGMKTGFICASGFNLVASATRDNRRLIAVVLGAPSSAVRAQKAAQMLERGFSDGGGLSWLLPSLGTVDKLQPINAAPPDLHEQICGPHRKRPRAENEDDEASTSADTDQQRAMHAVRPQGRRPRRSLLTGNPLAAVPPIVVYHRRQEAVRQRRSRGERRDDQTGEEEAGQGATRPTATSLLDPRRPTAKHRNEAATPKATPPSTAKPIGAEDRAGQDRRSPRSRRPAAMTTEPAGRAARRRSRLSRSPC